MSDLNPYAGYLDGRTVEAILADTAGQLGTLLAAIGTEKSAVAPAPGKWSPAEIVCHLADCDLAFGFRLRQTLAEEDHVIQPFDQEKWAVSYTGISAAQALEVFSALRGWNLVLIGKALPHAGNKAVRHPERGAMTFATIVETMAGHDLNHLGQLRSLAASTAG